LGLLGREARELGSWYLNLQEPFRRTGLGFDTQDLELDIVVSPDGSWRVKDDDKLEGWIERGRWTRDEVEAIRAEGRRLGRELDRGRRWWSDDWAIWLPDPKWPQPSIPEGWADPS
jgi:predicted RNA-binding protein associated with RNAse of E/G family